MDSQQYLFVNLTQGKRSEDRKIARKIRTHVMQDIGKMRRKPRKNLQMELKLHSPPPPLAQSRLDITSVVKPLNSKVSSLRDDDLEVEPHTLEFFTAGGLSRPFWSQDPLRTLDDSWGMDPFALYTMTLILNGGATSQSRILQFVFCTELGVNANPSQHHLYIRLAHRSGSISCSRSRLLIPGPFGISSSVQPCATLLSVTPAKGCRYVNADTHLACAAFTLLLLAQARKSSCRHMS